MDFEGNGWNGSVIAVLIYCARDGHHEGVTGVIRKKCALRSSRGCDGRNTFNVINEKTVTRPLRMFI